jgi:hypothetical protein
MKLREVKGIWDQLKALREITETTGVVHDAQIYQLKHWGPIALQHVREIEIALKLEEPPVCEFRAIGVTMAVPENFNQILEGLDRSVKSLLGRHWATRVLVDGEAIFEGQARPRAKKNLAKTIQRLKDADAAAKQGASTD